MTTKKQAPEKLGDDLGSTGAAAERPREGGPDQDADPAKNDSALIREAAAQRPSPGQVVLTPSIDPDTNASTDVPAMVAAVGAARPNDVWLIKAWVFDPAGGRPAVADLELHPTKEAAQAAVDGDDRDPASYRVAYWPETV